MKRLQLIVLALTCGVLGTAIAHTELSGSSPADGAVLESAPETVKLDFSAAVRLTALSLQRDGAEKQKLGPLPTDATDSFNIDVSALEDGHYTVEWRALSDDTHVMTGDFTFTVEAAANTA